MFRLDLTSDHANGGRQYGCVIGEAEHRQKVRHEVEWQDEIGKRAEQRHLHMQRRGAVEGAVIGGQQLFGERQMRRHTLELAPEVGAHAIAIPGKLLRRRKIRNRKLARLINGHWRSPTSSTSHH
jgi:hypothetical protein